MSIALKPSIVVAAATMLLGAVLCFQPASASDAGTGEFAFEDHAGQYLDILHGGKIVARYMYAFDPSSPESLHRTYKPYLHVFDVEGQQPITKGPGGKYTHHRGIFIGWSRVGFQGKRYDLWHMKGVNQVHQEFVARSVDGGTATVTARIHWNDPQGEPILSERRTMAIRKLPAPGMISVDVLSALTAVRGDVVLGGDPEHAGIQYRPANEIDASKTEYHFPSADADPRKDRDYPWVGESYTVFGKRYGVLHLNHPQNPKGTIYSAYRDYGRFGAFFTGEVKKDETLTVRYRILVYEGGIPANEQIQRAYHDFAGG